MVYIQKHADVQVPVSANIQDFTDGNFQASVVEASKSTPILVDFYAEWCFPCRMLEPILEEVAKELQGKAIVGRVNTDKNFIGKKFGINKIPTVFIIKNGEIKTAFYGVVQRDNSQSPDGIALRICRKYGVQEPYFISHLFTNLSLWRGQF